MVKRRRGKNKEVMFAHMLLGVVEDVGRVLGIRVGIGRGYDHNGD